MVSNSTASVTVVVPTYRRPDLLRTCLGSLQKQTYTDFTVLVCDNAADSTTAQVVKELKDPRFTYIPRRENLGILGNVIEGYRAVKSEFVMELDDDDALAPNCIERLVEPLIGRDDIALSFSDLEVIDASGRSVSPMVRRTKIQDSRELREGLYEDFTELAARGYVFTVAALLRRDAVDWTTIPEGATTAYDRYLAVQAARRQRGAYYVDERLAYYRIHADADSEQEFLAQCDGALFVLRQALQDASAFEQEILEGEITNLRFEIARFYVRERNWSAAARSVAVGILSPSGLHHAGRSVRGVASRIWPRR